MTIRPKKLYQLKVRATGVEPETVTVIKWDQHASTVYGGDWYLARFQTGGTLCIHADDFSHEVTA